MVCSGMWLHPARVMRRCASRREIAVAVSDHGRGVVRMFGLVPGLQVISSYRRQWLLKDVIAGVVLTTLLVPQGMAYAERAALPPVTRLFTAPLWRAFCL